MWLSSNFASPLPSPRAPLLLVLLPPPPQKDYPAVTVYHPLNSTYGLPWANVGFLGWVGSLTGVNQQRITIHEIGVAYPDETFGNQSLAGNPFIFLLRDILQFDASVPAAVSRITNTMRTAALILAVGDGKPGVPDVDRYRTFAYSNTKLTVMSDYDQLPWNNTADTWREYLLSAFDECLSHTQISLLFLFPPRPHTHTHRPPHQQHGVFWNGLAVPGVQSPAGHHAAGEDDCTAYNIA